MKPNRSKTRKKVMFGDANLPPGGVKIAKAMRKLLEKKAYESITTAEIAKKSGMNEALIYRHFGSKQDLLFFLVYEFHSKHHADLVSKLEALKGAFNKLRTIIYEEVCVYKRDRVYGRLITLELGAIPAFLKSTTYQRMKKEYHWLIKDVIREGVRTGEIRDDLSEWIIRQSILGTIRYVCAPWIVFKREMDPKKITNEICEIVFSGLQNKK